MCVLYLLFCLEGTFVRPCPLSWLTGCYVFAGEPPVSHTSVELHHMTTMTRQICTHTSRGVFSMTYREIMCSLDLFVIIVKLECNMKEMLKIWSILNMFAQYACTSMCSTNPCLHNSCILFLISPGNFSVALINPFLLKPVLIWNMNNIFIYQPAALPEKSEAKQGHLSVLKS